MKRKLVTLTVAAIMAVTSVFALIGCGGDDKPSAPPDTFYTGTLSAESYDSVNLAAQAFLSNEVCGDATDATFESYEKKADMTEEEIAELNLTESEKAEVDSAEKGVVNYTETPIQQSSVYASASSASSKQVKVYVIKFGAAYKYYTPSLETGDVLTKAYFDEVFDQSKYKNCTVNSNTTVVTSASAQGMTVNMSVSIKGTVKLTEECAYIKNVTTMSMLGQSQSTYTEMYIKFTGNDGFNGEYQVFMNEDGEGWIKADVDYIDMSEIGNIGEIDNDYSYFVKTKSGFKLNEDKFYLYLKDAMEDLGDSIEMVDLDTLKATAEYFVCDGKLTNVNAVVTASFNESGAKGSVKVTTTAAYSDFGTTAVEISM